jgi:hypothetical protein
LSSPKFPVLTVIFLKKVLCIDFVADLFINFNDILNILPIRCIDRKVNI